MPLDTPRAKAVFGARLAFGLEIPLSRDGGTVMKNLTLRSALTFATALVFAAFMWGCDETAQNPVAPSQTKAGTEAGSGTLVTALHGKKCKGHHKNDPECLPNPPDDPPDGPPDDPPPPEDMFEVYVTLGDLSSPIFLGENNNGVVRPVGDSRVPIDIWGTSGIELGGQMPVENCTTAGPGNMMGQFVIGMFGTEIFSEYRGGPHPSDRFSSQLRWNPGS